MQLAVTLNCTVKAIFVDANYYHGRTIAKGEREIDERICRVHVLQTQNWLQIRMKRKECSL